MVDSPRDVQAVENPKRKGNKILIGSSLLMMALSVPLIWVGSWQAKRYRRDCFKFLEFPILFLGISLFMASLLGFGGAMWKKRMLLWTHIISAFVLLLLLLAFTLFALFVTMGGGGHKVNGASYKEYRLHDFTFWFQHQTQDPTKWASMKSCIQDKKPCTNLDKRYPTLESFNNAHLSPTQSGCCKPPKACAFTFVTATYWENTTRATATSDCGRWENNPSILCYDCTSCRASLLQNVKEDWTYVAKVCLYVLCLLGVVYLIEWIGFLRFLWSENYKNLNGYEIKNTWQ